MMLLHLLLHVLIFHLLNAKGGEKDAGKANIHQLLGGHLSNTVKTNEKQHAVIQKDTNYVIKYVGECSTRGYYFLREPSPNKVEPDTCYLCFCQTEKTAVCWKRDNRRCNDEDFRRHDGSRAAKTHDIKSNDTRIRRSPGFADIFFRDASRDMFNKNTQDKQCKPYESSFSDDCPPADWCTGCTVCDCDANGRWDCHILSFCYDPKKGNQDRKVVKKKRLSGLPVGAQPRTSMPIWNPLMKRKKSGHRKKIVKQPVTPPRMPQRKQEKKKPPLRYKRIASKAKTNNAIIKKKNVATHKPVRINVNKVKNCTKTGKGVPTDMAQEIVKKMMTVVNKMVMKELRNITMLVAKMQQHNHKNDYQDFTTLTPRIIGGTRKRRPKRNIEEDHTKKPQSDSISFDGVLTPSDSSAQNSTVSASAKQEEKSTESTMFTIKSVITNDSISSKVEPMTNNSDLENDYYKYIVATSKMSLIQNQTTEDNALKSNVMYKSNMMDIINKTAIKKMTNYIPKFESMIVDDHKFKRPVNDGLENIDLTISKTGKKISIENTNTTVNATLDEIILNNPSYLYKIKEVNFSLPTADITGNEIVFNKWPQKKLAGEKIIKALIKNPLIMAKHMSNKTIVTKSDKYKIHRKKINRIIVTKKYNILKSLDYQRCAFLNKGALNENGTFVYKAGRKVPDAKNTLTKLFNKYYGSKKPRRKLKRFSVIKYLRKLFNNIFKQKNRSARISRYHILETLCEHFGPCSIQPKDKYVLRSKLIDLDHETMAILKTVRIIKGLLSLLNDSTYNNDTQSKQANLSSDIKKLNSIMKGNFGEHSKNALTQTKITQIEYVKKNVQDFVKSVGKFATLLDEIISLINKQEKTLNLTSKPKASEDPFQKLRDLLVKYNLVQNSFMKKMYDLVNSLENKFYEKTKVSGSEEFNSSITIENFSRTILKNLRKLKHLAQTLNYNGRQKRETTEDAAIEYLLAVMEYLLRQNKPLDLAPANDGIDLLLEAIRNAPDIKTIRKKVLVNTPYEFDTTMIAYPRNLLYRSSTDSSASDTESDSETMSKEDSDKFKVNVSDDALKMKIDEKDLFDIVDDDKDIEDKLHFNRRAEVKPVLTHATTREPVYDDIDNVTIGNSLHVFETTQSPGTSDEEDSFENNTINYSEDDKNIPYDVKSDNDNRNLNDNTEAINVFSNTINNNYDTITAHTTNYDTNTLHANSYVTNAVHPEDNDNHNFDTLNLNRYTIKTPYDTTNVVTEENFNENTVTDEYLTKDENNDKKIEIVYAGETDEEEVIPGTIDGSASETTTILSLELDYDKNKNQVKAIKTLDSYDNEKIDKKSKLEWIEENFRREYSNYDEDKEKSHEEKRAMTKTPNIQVNVDPNVTPDPTLTQKKGHSDVSLISNEGTDEDGKKSNINTEEVMYNKQMDLLNSLDYITEKVELDEKNSKDGTAGERYSETFPAYFV